MKVDPIANTVTMTEEEYLEFLEDAENRKNKLLRVPESLETWLATMKKTLEKINKEG